MMDRKDLARGRTLGIAAMGVSLSVFLLFVRARIMTFPWVYSAAALVPRATLAAYHDFEYVTAITLLFLALLRIARGSEVGQRIVCSAYVALALFSLLFALANVKVVPMPGRTLNYRWLYYSDFLDSQDVRNAIFAEVSGRLVRIAAACVVGLVALAWAIRRGLQLLARRFDTRRLAATIVGAPASLSRPWRRSDSPHEVGLFKTQKPCGRLRELTLQQRF